MKTIFTSMDPDDLIEKIREVVREEIKFVTTGNNEEELIKAKEACDLLKVSKVTLYKWIREDKINCYHLGTRLYFKKSELISALSKHSSCYSFFSLNQLILSFCVTGMRQCN